MTGEVTVAVISLAGSVLAAAFAWLQAVRTGRMMAAANVELERVKEEHEQRRRAFERAAQEAEPLERSLDEAWGHFARGEGRNLKVAWDGAYDLDVAMAEVKPAAQAIADGYAKCGAKLGEQPRQAWHSAKGATSVLIEVLARQIETVGHAELPPTDATLLSAIRMTLTDCQMALSKARQNVREDYVRRLLSWPDDHGTYTCNCGGRLFGSNR